MNLSGTHIIIVDDDPGLLEVMKMYLEMKGVHTYCATNGVQAYDLWRKTPGCQAIVSDIRMPGERGDGIHLTRRVREMDVNIPVVLISGYSEGAEETAMAAGASAYLNKPFEWKELEATIAELIQQKPLG